MRKTATITIAAEGRDKGKLFRIEEMPARQVERWERRALSCMAQTGVEVPDDVRNAGFGAIIAMGLKALLGLHGPEVEALHEELMACVTIHPDPTRPEIVRPLIEEDIEEVKTILTLKDEVIKLHAGFSVAAFLSNLWAEAAEKARALQTTSTSQEPSGQ